jgi:coenzyme PQQ precursor peptide PqqA
MMARLLASFRRGNGNQLQRKEKVPVMVPAVEIKWRNFVRDDARETFNDEGHEGEEPPHSRGQRLILAGESARLKEHFGHNACNERLGELMQWTAPAFEEVCLNCEINSYASAKL